MEEDVSVDSGFFDEEILDSSMRKSQARATDHAESLNSRVAEQLV